MASVTLDRVYKTYSGSDHPAVNDVSIEIADREFLVLVGPSGCGKSTTLRMVAGLEDIDQGSIKIGDRVVNNVAPKDRDIAMVFQNYALYPHMTVYKNMSFGLRMRKVPKPDIDRRVRQAAEMLGIEHLLDRKPKALSGGERQRVAVGRAIVRTPQAFLFDEPLSNLDARLRIQTRAELKRLHRKLQTTTIYVTHDQEEAMTLGDRIVIMKDGHVHQCASPHEVYNRPANRFVAGFIGMPPMNFFEGQLAQHEGKLVFDTGHGLLDLPSGAENLLRDRAGQSLVYGARPELLSIGSQGDAGGSSCLTMTVSVIEVLGNEKDVYLTLPSSQQVVARIAADVPADEGAEVRVFIETARAHIFEAGQSGANLTARVAR